MSIKSDLMKYTPRKDQQDCLNFINNVYQKNKSVKFFLLNLPPGIGKSYLALMIADWYSKTVNGGTKFDIITNSKILQDQYTDCYDSLNDLKGKENYFCKSYDCSCAQGIEFSRLNKTKCDGCPHASAKEGFLMGRISLTNFYLYILYQMYKTESMKSRGSKILIVDECHDLDEVMSDFISIKITEGVIKRLKFSDENDILSKLSKVTDITEYVDFLEFLKIEIATTISQIEMSLGSMSRTSTSDKRNNKLSKLLGGGNSDLKLMQILTDLDQYKSKIEIFLKEYRLNPNNWVLETQFNNKTNQNEISLEPIWAFDYLDKYIFSKYDMVFLMSGTILDKGLFCHLNGLDPSSSVYYSIGSPFPLSNRPIYYIPAGKMSFNKKVDTFRSYIPLIKRIMDKYPDKKGIIHTNSFELASWIIRDIKDPRLISHDSSNKDEVLREHFKTNIPTVLVSPSMDTGVSFDDEKARFQIIAKIPYPSLASQKNKLRKKNNPDWYSYRTVSGILQSYGRIVRSEVDYGDTIIIDGSFSDVIKYSSDLIPKWVQSSIKKIDLKKPQT